MDLQLLSHPIHPPNRMICVGFRRWKAANLKPMLSLDAGKVAFVSDVQAAARMEPTFADALSFWGAKPPQGLRELAQRTGATLLRMEDGFIRSVGLGSDLIRPHSLVLDPVGIYFDPNQPSALEQLLNSTVFTQQDLAAAAAVREFIVANGLTKYNLEPRRPTHWASAGRKVVLVPGQVEDDASIRLGCTNLATNAGLLQAARQAEPEAFIVYKPHPDVMSGNRRGRMAGQEVRQWADHVETESSVVSCLDACDAVHTLTSLTGFDALLRNKQVVTYGMPFYAGWGLTEDRLTDHPAMNRRTRTLQQDELVAGALLHYPLYWDWELKGYTTCMAVLHRLVERRQALESVGQLHKLKVGWWRRQWRKAKILATAYVG